MLSIYKTSIILYILAITTIGYVHSNCDVAFNSLSCGYDIYCTETDTISSRSINIDNYNYFVHNRYESDRNRDRANNIPVNEAEDENYDDMEIRNRRLCKYIDQYHGYGGEQFYPMHVTFKMSWPYPEIKKYEVNALITQLDLSNNNYEEVPAISEMNNLVQLNFSNNSLTVATLSNSIDLPELTEIDLSQNNIGNIIYEPGYVYKKLKKIDLSYNYLTIISEAVFDPFNKLETLDVSHNYIELLSPITFEGIKQLKHLNISYNRICDINSSLFRFIELKLLDLSNNNIKAVKATDFTKLTNLVTLDLSSNHISVIDKHSFNSMSFLRNLYLNNNKLGDIDKELFNNMTEMESIDLSENELKKIPKGLFKGKHIMNGFSIKDNQLEGSLETGMFEGLAVNKLDLSNQNLDSVQDYAFNGLFNLAELLLNNNNISVLTTNSFKTQRSLKRLDLSFNKIESIEFVKNDLLSLLSLSLRNNYLKIVKQENFHGLISLQFLDLSDNKITQMESNSFVSLKELINFQISNNPLSGTLGESTFDGLSSLPSLDISCTLLSSVKNGSFIGMLQLKNLNISHSKINVIEYNIFVHTGAIEIIDLSYNELNDFNVNGTELASLSMLYLNNNLIKVVDSSTFLNILSLTELSLSHNMIQNINSDVFKNQRYLRTLDVSFNQNLKLTLSLLNATKTLNILNLSGIKTGISFGNIKDISLTNLVITNSSVSDVKKIQLNELHHLDDLNLSHNTIPQLEVGTFNNISTLRFLDLSHNMIKYIQPGIFQDNMMLVSLNLSNNFLTAISYGIFRGLIYLRTLDISYNYINDLQNERFYEVKSLSVLIADHNKIESITAEEFLGTRLTKLSIGGNPILCDVLVNLKRKGVPFEITASKLYENNDENVYGVTCNRKLHLFDQITNISSANTGDNGKILHNIRDIMLEYLKHKKPNKLSPDSDYKYLVNISNGIETSNADLSKKISDFINSTAHVITENNGTNIALQKIYATIANNETNILLNKILKVLTLNSATRTPPVQVTKDNATYENLLSYINKVKQDLERTFKMDKDSILNEIEAKILAVNSRSNQNNIMLPTEIPKHEKLSTSDDSTKFLFTESCVALILVILVGFILFKVYKSGVFVRRRFSVSTRELPGSMDSPL